MSTAAERQARAEANAIELAQLADIEDRRDVLEQASADALVDVNSAPVQRLYINIQRIAVADNPDPVMRAQAQAWLKMTTGLVEGAKAIVVTKQAREAAASAPEPILPDPEGG